MTLNCQLFGWIRNLVLGGLRKRAEIPFFFVFFVRRQKLRRRCSVVKHFVFTACLAAASQPADCRRGFTPAQAELGMISRLLTAGYDHFEDRSLLNGLWSF